jgi:nitric-oxide synthase
MILTIGGIDYPCAPFNGFYMGTEIASRNFADEHRYDLLGDAARALGDDPAAPGVPFWKDRALLELNRAVLHSFDREGITIVDHHTASEQYMEFARREQGCGRVPSGDWSHIVPPQASAACEVFHLPMRDLHALPNFYHSRAVDGAGLYPNQDDELRRRSVLRWEDWRRRWWNWRRQRD